MSEALDPEQALNPEPAPNSPQAGPQPGGPEADPELVRAALFEAAALGDEEQLTRLAEAHAALVLERFEGWRRVPAAVKVDPAQLDRWARGLIGVAVHFARRRGEPQLLRLLESGRSPLTRWTEVLGRAQRLRSELELDEAAALLTDLLIDTRGLSGDGAEHFRAVTFGLLGDVYFQAGQTDRALGPTRRALELCQGRGDAQGVRIYVENLFEVHRWREEREEAGACAERLAGLHEEPSDARWWAAQAQVSRAGEPLLRVVVEVPGGHLVELAQAEPAGRVRFAFRRNRATLLPSSSWTARGESFGRAGKFEDALDAFAEAGRHDPHDPHPHYQAAVTLLHLERYHPALEEYAQAETLAPGWFHVRAYLWLAEAATRGRIPHEALELALRLDDGQPDPSVLPRIESALRDAPHLALLHLARGRILRAQSHAGAEEALRAGLEAAQDEDVRSRLQLELATQVADEGERQGLLESVARGEGNLIAAATAQLLLRV